MYGNDFPLFLPDWVCRIGAAILAILVSLGLWKAIELAVMFFSHIHWS